ncbi:hypothetical protein BGZ96_011668 [Linnemannia gamsii]|uniref:Uncharacterized protein n=1 Tax=Linnemannia gamsii TaxID=64522 RepID=A0ABQ7JSG5_9FUNG|nr:hypothetical protein BGZ96_011668 [Linnemannia gamsii]
MECYLKTGEQGREEPQEIMDTNTQSTDDLAALIEMAKSGHPITHVTTGDMYEEGKSVKQDYSAAVEWKSNAGQQGDPTRQCRVGYL